MPGHSDVQPHQLARRQKTAGLLSCVAWRLTQPGRVGPCHEPRWLSPSEPHVTAWRRGANAGVPDPDWGAARGRMVTCVQIIALKLSLVLGRKAYIAG